MVLVGIDVAKDKHDCFIISSEGEVLADVFTITNNKEGYEKLEKYHFLSAPFFTRSEVARPKRAQQTSTRMVLNLNIATAAKEPAIMM